MPPGSSPAMPAGFPEIKQTSNRIKTMEEGNIRLWNVNRSFGFIQIDCSRRDIFVHFSEIKNRAPEAVKLGDVIQFHLASDQQGRLLAKNARIIDEPTTGCKPVRFGDIGADEAA
jgi:cold shock CspA family protein